MLGERNNRNLKQEKTQMQLNPIIKTFAAFVMSAFIAPSALAGAHGKKYDPAFAEGVWQQNPYCARATSVHHCYSIMQQGHGKPTWLSDLPRKETEAELQRKRASGKGDADLLDAVKTRLNQTRAEK